jgi:elongation factor Ts
MVQIDTSSGDVAAADVLRRTAADIAMHITATNPLALDKDGIAAEIIKREKAIYAEQVKNKPANIVDKIVEGKMKKFYAENCLLEQLFVKDDSKTVAQVLAEAARQAGGTAKIKRFARFDVG